jgi:demethylmenaquinone methyltransferase / 2-methoxy-6-polyprenyl-1,4-benzoquinol methylase
VTNEANAAAFDPVEDDVFARIADKYDLLCDIFSFGIHRLWKRAMARHIASLNVETALDIASGPGDIPIRLVGRTGAPRDLIVTDLSPRMISLATTRLSSHNHVRVIRMDAHTLDGIADNSVDLVSMSFGMKICDRPRVLAAALRVLKPGGVFLNLEAARIPVPLIHKAYLTYMDICLPLISSVATGGDRSAYDYLLRGIHTFPGPAGFSEEIARAGFAGVNHTNYTGGIVALHEARKPVSTSAAP